MATRLLPNPDDPNPVTPTTFVVQTLSALWENLPHVVLGGVIFSLFCVPTFFFFVMGWWVAALITVPLLVAPAWSALMRLQGLLLAERAATVMEMITALPRYWRASFRLGVLGIVPLYLLLRLLPAVTVPAVAWLVWVAFFLTLLLAALLWAIYLYAFPLLVLQDAPLLETMRNSTILASRYAGNTVGLLSLGVLLTLAVAFLSMALIFVLPTLYAFFIICHCRMVVGGELTKYRSTNL